MGVVLTTTDGLLVLTDDFVDTVSSIERESTCLLAETSATLSDPPASALQPTPLTSADELVCCCCCCPGLVAHTCSSAGGNSNGLVAVPVVALALTD